MSLHTTATENSNEGSVLKALRALMPPRALHYHEALERAELQANHLLDLHQISDPHVSSGLVTELPRFQIRRTYDIPSSGSAHWDGLHWVLTLNAGEPRLRQRFSLMHEFKHVLDHPFKGFGAADALMTFEDQEEKVADYFAACVLMPRWMVKRAFCSGTQSTTALARLFDVSAKAMSVRLRQLGLTEPVARCLGRPSSRPAQRATGRHRPTYYRSAPVAEVLR